MKPVRVAILGACGWMGKVHTMAYGNIPFLFGEENGSAEVAWLQAEAVRSSLAAHPLVPELPAVHVSAGVAELRHGDTLGQALRRADQAAYQAKSMGRNRVVLNEQDDSSAGPNVILLEGRRRAGATTA